MSFDAVNKCLANGAKTFGLATLIGSSTSGDAHDFYLEQSLPRELNARTSKMKGFKESSFSRRCRTLQMKSVLMVLRWYVR